MVSQIHQSLFRQTCFCSEFVKVATRQCFPLYGKLSFDVGVYIFVLLKVQGLVFFNEVFCQVGKHSTNQLFVDLQNLHQSFNNFKSGNQQLHTKNMDTIYVSHECVLLGLMSWIQQHDGLSENMALTPHTPTTLHFHTRKQLQCRVEVTKVGLPTWPNASLKKTSF